MRDGKRRERFCRLAPTNRGQANASGLIWMQSANFQADKGAFDRAEVRHERNGLRKQEASLPVSQSARGGKELVREGDGFLGSRPDRKSVV